MVVVVCARFVIILFVLLVSAKLIVVLIVVMRDVWNVIAQGNVLVVVVRKDLCMMEVALRNVKSVMGNANFVGLMMWILVFWNVWILLEILVEIASAL